jgi:hypothetical protein
MLAEFVDRSLKQHWHCFHQGTLIRSDTTPQCLGSLRRLILCGLRDLLFKEDHCFEQQVAKKSHRQTLLPFESRRDQ